MLNFPSGQPVEVSLDRLSPDQPCFYRLRYRPPGTDVFAAGGENSFHPQRAPGSTFTFEIQDPESAAVCSTEDGYAYVIMPLARDH